MHDPTRISSFDLGTFDPCPRPRRPRRQVAAATAPTARPPKRETAAEAVGAPVDARVDFALPPVDPAEVAALRADLAALRAELAAIKAAPAVEARREALAKAWAADMAWRGRQGGQGL